MHNMPAFKDTHLECCAHRLYNHGALWARRRDTRRTKDGRILHESLCSWILIATMLQNFRGSPSKRFNVDPQEESQ